MISFIACSNIAALSALLFATALPACTAEAVRRHTLEPAAAAAITDTVTPSVISVNQLSVVQAERADLGPFPIQLVASKLMDFIGDDIAKRRIGPLLEQTRDVSLGDLYQSSLECTLGKVRWPKLGRLERRDSVAASDQRRARLEIATAHLLSRQSSVLYVQSTLALYRAGAAVETPSAQVRTFYRSDEVSAERGNQAVSHWARNRGQAYRVSVAEGVAESMKMTTMAIEHMAGTRYAGNVESLLVWIAEPAEDGADTTAPVAVSGVVVEETPHRLILEVSTGEFDSLPKSAIGSRDVIGASRGVTWKGPACSAPPPPAALPEPPAAPALPSEPAATPW